MVIMRRTFKEGNYFVIVIGYSVIGYSDGLLIEDLSKRTLQTRKVTCIKPTLEHMKTGHCNERRANFRALLRKEYG